MYNRMKFTSHTRFPYCHAKSHVLCGHPNLNSYTFQTVSHTKLLYDF